MPDPQMPTMTAGPAPLGAEDYTALLGMMLSKDSSVRSQGAALAKKLTPDEHQEFFDFQQAANNGSGELHRSDNQVALGVAPEFAAAGAIGVGKAVAGATGAIPKIAAGAGNVLIPQVKYWVTKAALVRMGVPSKLAEGAALAVSSLGKGGKAATPEAEAPMEAPASAPAETLPAPSAPGSAAAPQSVSAPPATGLTRNDLLVDEKNAFDRLTKAGKDPDAVLDAIAQHRQQTQTTLVSQAPQKPSLAAAEAKEYLRLTKSGQSPKDALSLILQQRAMVSRLGLPSAEDARMSVVDRNAAGRWPGE